jgi:3-mercaptopyruvate sulfurtransferase SseA
MKIINTAFFGFAALLLGCQSASSSNENMAVVQATPVIVSSVATPPPPTPDNAPRISLADAKAAFDAGTAYIIDTRGESAYKEEHIKGAVNITAATLATKIKDIPKDKKLIVYCS